MVSRSRMLPLVGLIASAALMACSGSDDGEDTPTGPVDVKVDTFNTALAGAFIPNIDARREPLRKHIAAADADIICLQEVWEQDDKDKIAEQAKDTFPYAVVFHHDWNTKVDDPADQDGNVPPAHTEAPCSEPDIKAKFEKVIECVKTNCSDGEGYAVSTSCVEEKCLAAAATLLAAEKPARCYGCAATNLPTEKIDDIEHICETQPNASLAFRGQSGVMILSKYPLSNKEAWVLPGTWNRRVIINATASLPNGAQLDVYCNHLTPIFNSLTFPYTGDYGQGHYDAEGWEAEQMLQAHKLVEYVKKHGEGRKAVILGDFNAGREYKQGDKTILYAEGADTLEFLSSAFPELLPAGFAPVCTYCDTNGNNDTDKSEWIDHIFGFGLGPADTVDAHRTFDQDIVDGTVIEPDGSTHPGKVPLSDHYGMQATVRIEAP